MKTTTKTGRIGVLAELEAKVAKLEAEVADLDHMVIQTAMERDQAVHQLCQRDAQLAAAKVAPSDALMAFAASLPRKQLYRILARALHPDVGGDTRTMQDLTAAWDATAN